MMFNNIDKFIIVPGVNNTTTHAGMLGGSNSVKHRYILNNIVGISHQKVLWMVVDKLLNKEQKKR